MAASPQDRCFQCNTKFAHDFRAESCAQCGESIDHTTVVFRPGSRRWVKYAIATAVVASVCSSVSWIGWDIGFLESIGMFACVGLSGVVALFFGVEFRRRMGHLRSIKRRGPFVALTAKECIALTVDQGLQRIPYDQIAFVSVVDFYPWIQARSMDVVPQNLVDTPYQINLMGVFDSDEEKRDFKRMMNGRMAAVSTNTNAA